jgi:subtilisin family serine protease
MKTLLCSLALGAALATAPAAQLSSGLDRIDQRYQPIDGSFSPYGTGAGVNIYVVSTGIRYTHPEFGGRAYFGYAFDGNPGDCNGYGTALASVAAGATVGAAPGASIIDVKVLNCAASGTTPGIVAGLQWVLTDFLSGGKRPSVVLIGFSGGPNGPVEAAIQSLIDADLPVVMMAGNSGADACDNIGPLHDAIKVGASEWGDTVQAWSNQGCCVDLFAPGKDIPVADGMSSGYSTRSGTGFAAALATGAVAVNLGATPPPVMTPGEAEFQLEMEATPWILTGLSAGSPNRLLHLGPTAPSRWYAQQDLGMDTHPHARIAIYAEDAPVLSAATSARLIVEGAPAFGSLYFVLDLVPGTCFAPNWVNGLLATPCAALPAGAILPINSCGALDTSWPTNLLPPGATAWMHAIVLSGPAPWDLTNALQLQY